MQTSEMTLIADCRSSVCFELPSRTLVIGGSCFCSVRDIRVQFWIGKPRFHTDCPKKLWGASLERLSQGESMEICAQAGPTGRSRRVKVRASQGSFVVPAESPAASWN